MFNEMSALTQWFCLQRSCSEKWIVPASHTKGDFLLILAQKTYWLSER